MPRQPFEIISALMTKLNAMLVSHKIDYGQWVDSYSMFDALGWSDEEICLEIDRRWLPQTN